MPWFADLNLFDTFADMFKSLFVLCLVAAGDAAASGAAASEAAASVAAASAG